MTASGRFVADTNVLVSFVLRPNSTPGRAVTTALLDHLMVFSETTYPELDQVLMRSKFDRYVSRRQRRTAPRLFRDAAVHVETSEVIQACSDPRDDRILEAAVAGGAKLILSGDKALLELNPFRDIAIQTPAEYLQQVRGQNASVPDEGTAPS
jgi:putative PIN family toxin of toxin-antitoxin system